VEWNDGGSLEGAPSDRYPAGVLHVRPGPIDGRYVLRAWLDALLCAAAGVATRVMLVGFDGKGEARSFELPQVGQQGARERLRALIGLHEQGRRAPLPFFVRTSWDHALACAEAGGAFDTAEIAIGIDVFVRAARQSASGNGFGGFSEFESDAVCMAWRGRDLPGPLNGELALSLHRTALEVFAHPARAWAEQFA
jgi:exonuclease V gamma subunit